MRKQSPKNVQFLLADFVREEVGGKLTVMGLYSSAEVLLQGEIPKAFPEGVKGLAIPSLTIVAVVVDGLGKFNARINLFDPYGMPLGIEAKGPGMVIDKVAAGAANILIPISPFPIPAFGEYRLELELDTKKYFYSFKIRHSNPAVRFPQVEEPAPARRTKAKTSPEKPAPTSRTKRKTSVSASAKTLKAATKSTTT